MTSAGRRVRVVLMRAAALVCAVAGAVVACAMPAQAQIGSDRYSSIVVDATTGNVLEAANPDAPRHPASLAKLMTLYLVFEALRDRRVAPDELVPVSPHAASMEPSKLGLVPGMRMTVQEGILALVTKSANDAASALGELLGGSEDRFAQMMTLRARALGMNHTTFTNASGLPDPNEWTTARDLAMLARHIITDFPGFYPLFSTHSFVFQHRVIFNHDRMLASYPGADGLKTGYTDASGHNLITSAMRGGVRLIGVVLGAGSNAERDVHMTMLLNQGFEEMDVPIERHPLVASRMPSLIGTAHAATLTMQQTVKPVARPNGPTSWAVQVGTFGNERAARAAAANARHDVDEGEVRLEAAGQRGHTFWRAQLTGLTAGEAQEACTTLAHHRLPCMVMRPDQRQVASR